MPRNKCTTVVQVNIDAVTIINVHAIHIKKQGYNKKRLKEMLELFRWGQKCRS